MGLTSNPALQYTPGSDVGGSSTGTDSSTLGTAISTGTDIYSLLNSIQLNNAARGNLSQSNPFGAFRPLYGQQLLQLLQNPSSISKLPGYQFTLDQGVGAIDRSAAAPGGKGFASGGEMTDLMKFGEGLASQYYFQDAELLAQLAGANINPANAAQMLYAAGGAQSSTGSSIRGLANDANNIYKIYNQFAGGSGADLSTAGDVGSVMDTSGLSSVASNDAGFSAVLNSDLTSAGYGSDVAAASTGGDAIDLAGLFSGPSAAGGEAAATGTAAGAGTGIGAGAGAGAGAAVSADLATAGATTAAETGATAYGVDLAAETATAESGAAAGAGSVAAAVAPYAAALAPIAVAAYGASKPGTQLSSTWYNNFGNTISAGLSPQATVQQKLLAASQLDQLGLLQLAGTGGGTGFSTATDFNMGRLMDVLSQYGINNLQEAQALATQLYSSISAGQMPGQSANQFGTTTVGVGNMGDLVKVA